MTVAESSTCTGTCVGERGALPRHWDVVETLPAPEPRLLGRIDPLAHYKDWGAGLGNHVNNIIAVRPPVRFHLGFHEESLCRSMNHQRWRNQEVRR